MSISRRNLFRGAASASLLAPFAKYLGSPSVVSAQVAAPKRFLVVMSIFGTVPDEWRPDGGETDFRLRRVLAPLEPYRSHLMPLWGVGIESAEQLGGEGHQRGVFGALTGAQFASSGGGISQNVATDKSVDQIIADRIGSTTRVRSLEIGIEGGGGINWRARDQHIPFSSDAGAAFDRLFSDFTPGGGGGSMANAEAERRVRLRRSLLSHQRDSIARLQRAVPSSDRARLEQHLDHVRDLEMRLASGGGTTEPVACTVPARSGQGSNNAQRVRINSDLVLAALTCGVTNVATTVWAPGESHEWSHLYPDDDHTLSHEYLTPGTEAVEKLISRCRWQAEELAYILGRLRAVPEGDGTMLDNTVILWANDMQSGWHTHRDMPFLVAGNVKGADGNPYFNMGRLLRFETGTAVNRLHLTLANAFGANLTAFGDRDFSGAEFSNMRR